MSSIDDYFTNTVMKRGDGKPFSLSDATVSINKYISREGATNYKLEFEKDNLPKQVLEIEKIFYVASPDPKGEKVNATVKINDQRTVYVSTNQPTLIEKIKEYGKEVKKRT